MSIASWLKLMLSLLLCSLIWSLQAQTAQELRQKYPRNNLRIGTDLFAWAQNKANVVLGMRRDAVAYGLFYQAGSETESGIDFDYTRIGVDFKRYYFAQSLVARLTANHYSVEVKNAFDTDSVSGWELQTQLGYRYFIEPVYWFEAFIGVSSKVMPSPELKPSVNELSQPVKDGMAVQTPSLIGSIEFTYEWRLFPSTHDRRSK